MTRVAARTACSGAARTPRWLALARSAARAARALGNAQA